MTRRQFGSKGESNDEKRNFPSRRSKGIDFAQFAVIANVSHRKQRWVMFKNMHRGGCESNREICFVSLVRASEAVLARESQPASNIYIYIYIYIYNSS